MAKSSCLLFLVKTWNGIRTGLVVEELVQTPGPVSSQLRRASHPPRGARYPEQVDLGGRYPGDRSHKFTQTP